MKRVDDKHHLHNFVYWRQAVRAGHKGAQLVSEEKTLDCVAQLVERVLASKSPLALERGRKANTNGLWLGFHMVETKPFLEGKRPKRSGKKGETPYSEVGKQLGVKSEAINANYYKARKQLKNREGRQAYIEWLNHRECRWEAYQAAKEKRAPAPCEYAFSGTMPLSVVCLLRDDEDAEPRIVPLSPKELASLVNEAKVLLKSRSGKSDYRNWQQHRGVFLYFPAMLLPSKAGRPPKKYVNK